MSKYKILMFMCDECGTPVDVDDTEDENKELCQECYDKLIAEEQKENEELNREYERSVF